MKHGGPALQHVKRRGRARLPHSTTTTTFTRTRIPIIIAIIIIAIVALLLWWGRECGLPHDRGIVQRIEALLLPATDRDPGRSDGVPFAGESVLNKEGLFRRKIQEEYEVIKAAERSGGAGGRRREGGRGRGGVRRGVRCGPERW